MRGGRMDMRILHRRARGVRFNSYAICAAAIVSCVTQHVYPHAIMELVGGT